MKLYEYGMTNPTTLLFFASCILEPYWAYQESIAILAQRYHVYVMVPDGHDVDTKEDFTSIEKNIKELVKELNRRNIQHFDVAYGLSMGGSMLLHLVTTSTISMNHIIIDAGITPYAYPKWICKVILWKDVFLATIIKNNRWLVERLFPPSRYTVKGHDAKEEYDRLMHFFKTYSQTTLKNAFYSANNYYLPKKAPYTDSKIIYWYGELERKQRKKDIAFIKHYLPQCKCKQIDGYNHGELMFAHPKEFYNHVQAFLTI